MEPGHFVLRSVREKLQQELGRHFGASRYAEAAFDELLQADVQTSAALPTQRPRSCCLSLATDLTND